MFSLVKILPFAFALLGFAATSVAAVYWWKASRIPILQSEASICDVPELYILSTQVAFNESSRLNAYAAKWTGAAAVLSGLSAVVGASPF